MRCLLVIPAFNESARLPAYLRALLLALDRAALECDVLVVDDGSGDDEVGYVRDLAAMLRPLHARLLEPLCLEKNRGKGGAVHAGWDAAEDYKWVGFVDADGSISEREVVRLIALAITSERPVTLFGSRVKMLGRRVERSALRHWTGRFFAFLVGLSVSGRVYDSQCGIKLIPVSTLCRIRPWLCEQGFCFDVELLAAHEALGLPILEVPIDWVDTPGTKVRLFRDTTRMVLALLRISHRRRSWMSLKAPTSLPIKPLAIGITARNSTSSSSGLVHSAPSRPDAV